jgi:hypothetical protein
MVWWCRADPLESDGKWYPPSVGDPPHIPRLKFGAVLSIGPNATNATERFQRRRNIAIPTQLKRAAISWDAKANAGNPTLMIGGLSKEDGKTAIARNQSIGRSQSAQGE